jgi:uncharacterized RDD family membrane protein YckC
MKCPKCSYLGFETGDRCRNCGYDFSLLSAAAAPDIDVPLRSPEPFGTGSPGWADELGHSLPGRAGTLRQTPSDPLAAMPLDTIAAAATPRAPSDVAAAGEQRRGGLGAGASSLPLFQPVGAEDEPLIKVPASPRPPLAVRRTPDRPRRSAPKPVRRFVDAAPVMPVAFDAPLQFADEPRAVPSAHEQPRASDRAAAAPVVASGATRRLAAACIDHGILLAVDAIVVYFTIKMAALTLTDWRLLPPVPLAAFLVMLKLAYFFTFTLVGGQTIGKMAMRIRVIADDGSPLEPGRAIQRTFVGAVSLLAVGAGLVHLLIASDRRGLHDRMAGTRVVVLSE